MLPWGTKVPPATPRRPASFRHARASPSALAGTRRKHQLKDTYFAENAILKALPKMAQAARSDALRGAFGVVGHAYAPVGY
jgi:hypothetical protein